MEKGIFDLSLWKRLRGKDYLWGVLVVASAASVYFAAPNFLGEDTGRNSVKRRARHLEPQELTEQDVKILFTGNSLVAESVVASRIRIPSVNLAMGGADYAIQWSIIESALERFPNLDTLVIGLGELPLLNKNYTNEKYAYPAFTLGATWRGVRGAGIEERLSFAAGQMLWTRPIHFGPKVDAKFLLKRFERVVEKTVPVLEAPRALMTSVLSVDPRLGVDSLGRMVCASSFFGGDSEGRLWAGFPLINLASVYRPEDGEKKMGQYRRAFRHERSLAIDFEENTRCLYLMIEAANARGIDVVFVRPPCAPEFVAARPVEWLGLIEQVHARCEELVGEEIPFWNDEASEEYALDEHFEDPNHLNGVGAKIYTASLYKKIHYYRRGR